MKRSCLFRLHVNASFQFWGLIRVHTAKNGRKFKKQERPFLVKCKKCGLIRQAYLRKSYYFPPHRWTYPKKSYKPLIPPLSQICKCLVAHNKEETPHHCKLYVKALAQYHRIKEGVNASTVSSEATVLSPSDDAIIQERGEVVINPPRDVQVDTS